jgi:hypothetical protein
MKKLFELIFKGFWVNLAIMFAISIADLIGLTLKSPIGFGFIITFLYFVGWIIYTMTKKDGEDRHI